MEADLVEVAAPFKSFHSAFDNKEAHSLVALGGVGLDRHDHEIRIDAIGDEGLGSVDHVVVAVTDG
ncbi:unannotated protein [freshwater metagenome]|uniref:Unannotated protein n=1 Tax=freshwater metagenome TaxID=449393 RepID=A0A6J7JJT8_9ZZZZ